MTDIQRHRGKKINNLVTTLSSDHTSFKTTCRKPVSYNLPGIEGGLKEKHWKEDGPEQGNRTRAISAVHLGTSNNSIGSIDPMSRNGADR